MRCCSTCLTDLGCGVYCARCGGFVTTVRVSAPAENVDRLARSIARQLADDLEAVAV